MNDVPKVNTGVIEGSGTKDLYVAGKIPYEVRLKSGDWRPYLPSGEKQHSQYADFMACVSFSNTSDLEIQSILTGVEPNWSDRALAKMSGTTHQGNRLDTVADTARLQGLIKEEDYPTVGQLTWDQYYAPIPQNVLNKAVKLNIAYETVPLDKASLAYHLKQAPLQITIPAPHPNHAVVLVHLDGNTAYYFDSYSPYLKTINVSSISYAMKIVLKESMQLINDNGTVYLVAGSQNKRVTGISDPEVLQALFGDELITGGKIPSPPTQTLSNGIIIHKN
jgi:hypothetical protein